MKMQSLVVLLTLGLVLLAPATRAADCLVHIDRTTQNHFKPRDQRALERLGYTIVDAPTASSLEYRRRGYTYLNRTTGETFISEVVSISGQINGDAVSTQASSKKRATDLALALDWLNSKKLIKKLKSCEELQSNSDSTGSL